MKTWKHGHTRHVKIGPLVLMFVNRWREAGRVGVGFSRKPYPRVRWAFFGKGGFNTLGWRIG